MKKGISLLAAVSLLLNMSIPFVTVNASVPEGATAVLQEGFEQDTNSIIGLYETDTRVYAMHKSDGAFLTDDNVLVLGQNWNYGSKFSPDTYIAGSNLSSEGANCYLEIEFDVKVHNIAAMEEMGNIFFGSADSPDYQITGILFDAKTYKDTDNPNRIMLKCRQGSTAGSSSTTQLGEFEDDRWYRIRTVIQLTDENSAQKAKFDAVYINGENCLDTQNEYYLDQWLDSRITNFNRISTLVNAWEGTVSLDNLNIYKYNSNDGAKVIDNAECLIGAIWQAQAFLNKNRNFVDEATAEQLENAIAEQAANYSEQLTPAEAQEYVEQVEAAVDRFNRTMNAFKYYVENNFEGSSLYPFSGSAGSIVNDNDPFVGKAFRLKGNADANAASHKTDRFTSIPLLTEECLAITEMDLRFNGIVKNKSSFEFKFYMEESSDTTPVSIMQFNGETGKIKMREPNNVWPELCEFEDDVWYRLKVVIKGHKLNPEGTNGPTIDVYMNDVLVGEDVRVTSYTASKAGEYNQLFFNGPYGSTCSVDIDNLKIYKLTDSLDVYPVDYSPSVGAVRKASALIAAANVGDSETDYDEAEYNTFAQKVEDFTQLVLSTDEQSTLDTALAEFKTAISEFKPNGKSIMAERSIVTPYSITDSDNSINVKTKISTSKRAGEKSYANSVAVLLKQSDNFEGGELVDIMSEKVELAKLAESTPELDFNISGISTDDKAKLFMKTFVLSGETSTEAVSKQADKFFNVPQFVYTDKVGTGAVSIEDSIMSDNTRKVSVKVKGNAGESIAIIVLKNGFTADSLKTNEAYRVCEYINMSECDENGRVTFDFIPSDENGNYNYFFVSESDVSGGNFHFASKTYVDNALDEIKTQKTSDIYETYIDYLKTDKALFDSAKQLNIDVNDVLTDMFSSNETYTTETLTDFADEIDNRLNLLVGVKKSASIDEIDGFITSYNQYLSNGNSYTLMSKKNKDSVCTYILQNVNSVKKLGDVANLITNAPLADNNLSSGGMGTLPSAPSMNGGGGGGGGAVKPFAPLVEEKDLPVNTAESSFTDISGFEWAEEAIRTLTAIGCINGKGNGIFAPNDNVTREEFVKMIVILANEYDENAVSQYKDAGAEKWYTSYVASAQNSGIVNGISDELFGAGSNITREDMALICYRVCKMKNAEFTENGEYIPFDDDEIISEYAKEAVTELAKSGVINGMDGKYFKPQDYCTRAQAAKILYEVYKIIAR